MQKIGYPFAVTITKGTNGKYTARSKFGRTVAGYCYTAGMGDVERQALVHARHHANKYTAPNRRILVAELPNKKGCVAIVLPEIDPASRLYISATYHYPRGQAYGLHRVRVTKVDENGHWKTLVDAEGTGGNGQHYETAFHALVAAGLVSNDSAAHGSLYWREVLEAVDNGYTEVPRKKDM